MTSVHKKVLDAYKLPPFSEIISDNFRDRFELLPARQYGIACSDVQAECTRAESLGAGPFLSANISASSRTEFGRRLGKGARLEFALGYTEDSEIEFLGPGVGSTFYSDALEGSSSVLHHVGIYQNGIEKIEQRLNDAGYETVVSGGFSLGWLFGAKYLYFDTRSELGCYLEILDFYVFGKVPIPIQALVGTLAKRRVRD
jgi:hypothetical protein